MHLTTALLLCLAVVVPPSPAFSLLRSPGDTLPLAEALDGERGFGAGLDPEVLRRCVRRPEPEDGAFLDGLWTLARDVEILGSVAAVRYTALDYFTLVDDPRERHSRSISALHRDVRAYERRAMKVALGDRRGLALARVMADPYFQARMRVLVGTEYEVSQLRKALNLLIVHAHGKAELLRGTELDELTWRADLAAARLRAAREDLEALYQSAVPEVGEGDSASVLHLARALSRGGGEGAARLMRDVQDETRDLERELSNGRLAAFDRDHKAALTRREARSRRALQNYAEILRILPLLPDGRLPSDLEGKISDRYRKAANTGLEAAANDPLIAEVHYMIGLSYDFVSQELARPRLDRYLALRGIRHWEYQTYASKQLNVQEKWALYVVAGWKPPKDG
jgi:hypothetical protein